MATTKPSYMAQATHGSRKRVAGARGPCTTTTTIMTVGGRKNRRRQEDNETTTTGVATTTICPRVCDNHHYYPEEEERLVMTTVTGDIQAQGEACHYDSTTRKTAMVTTMQDRLQERLDKIRTSSYYIIRLTDRLRLKLLAFFSQFSDLNGAFPRFRPKGPFYLLKIHWKTAH